MGRLASRRLLDRRLLLRVLVEPALGQRLVLGVERHQVEAGLVEVLDLLEVPAFEDAGEEPRGGELGPAGIELLAEREGDLGQQLAPAPPVINLETAGVVVHHPLHLGVELLVEHAPSSAMRRTASCPARASLILGYRASTARSCAAAPSQSFSPISALPSPM